jgi:hypothetical protein
MYSAPLPVTRSDATEIEDPKCRMRAESAGLVLATYRQSVHHGWGRRSGRESRRVEAKVHEIGGKEEKCLMLLPPHQNEPSFVSAVDPTDLGNRQST